MDTQPATSNSLRLECLKRRSGWHYVPVGLTTSQLSPAVKTLSLTTVALQQEPEGEKRRKKEKKMLKRLKKGLWNYRNVVLIVLIPLLLLPLPVVAGTKVSFFCIIHNFMNQSKLKVHLITAFTFVATAHIHLQYHLCIASVIEISQRCGSCFTWVLLEGISNLCSSTELFSLY